LRKPGAAAARRRIPNGTLYWGYGYTRLFFRGTNNKLFASSSK
jgi:hypothetical protein